MKTRLVSIFIFALMVLLAGCQRNYGLDPKKPVTLSLWHNYGGQMKDTMDKMVDEFNQTVGAEKGIILSVTSISSSSTLHEKLIKTANRDPGMPMLPDITTANPKTAIILAEKDLLVDLGEQFSKEELSAYVPCFLEEGRLEGRQLYIFPTAKSTEVLYLNKTVFDRFSKITGARYEDLRTFEGLANIAKLYNEWTDAQTPAILNDGKTFYHIDSLFNFTQVGCKQLGTDFMENGGAQHSSEAFQRVWSYFYQSAVRGYFAIYDGYASDLAKTGDIVCSTGSTAGVLFFDPLLTYADNTKEPVELMILPYPIFEGGKKIAIQRGSGMLVTKSTEAKEHAAGIFLKWFTSPKNNLRFVASTGYLPVTEEAFGEVMFKEIDSIENKNIKNLLTTAVEMQSNYDFYIPPLYEGIDVLQKEYETKLKQTAAQSRKSYQVLLGKMSKDAAFNEASKGVFETFIK